MPRGQARLAKYLGEETHARSMTKFVVLLFVFLAPGSLVHAQGTEPADKTGASPYGCNRGGGQPVAQRGRGAAKDHRGTEGDGPATGGGKLQSAQTVPANAQGQAGNGALWCPHPNHQRLRKRLSRRTKPQRKNLPRKRPMSRWSRDGTGNTFHQEHRRQVSNAAVRVLSV